MEAQDLSSRVVLISGVVIALCILYIIRKALLRYIFRKYVLKLEFGRIGWLSLRNIHILLRDGTNLEIEELWLSSCLFHRNLRSLVVICVSDVRLQGDSLNKPPQKNKSINNKKRSPWLYYKLLSLSKYVSIQAYNVSVMKLGTPQEEFLLHVSFQELTLRFKTSNGLWLDSSIASSSIKVFKHLPSNQEQTRSSESCLGHFTADINLKIEIVFDSETQIQFVLFKLVKPELILYEGFSINTLKAKTSDDPHSNSFDDFLSNHNQDAQLIDPVITFLKKIPFEAEFQMDSFSLKFMKEGGHKAFTMGISHVEAKVMRNQQMQDINSLACSFSFCIQDVTATSSNVQFSQLFKLAYELQVKNKAIVSKIQLSSLTFWYDKEVFQYWLGVIPLNSSNGNKNPLEAKPKQSSWALDAFDSFHFQHITELDNISFSAKLPGCNAFSIGLDHCHFSFADYFVPLAMNEAVFHQCYTKDICLEILVETLYARLGEECLPDSSVVKRYHVWNVPFSVGMILLKAKFHLTDYTVNCMADNVQFEWSPNLALLVTSIHTYTRTSYPPPRNKELSNAHGSMTKKSPSMLFAHLRDLQNKNLVLQLNITAINIFCLSEIRNAIIARIEFLTIENQMKKCKVDIDSFKLSTTPITATPYLCIKSSEMKLFVSNISQSCIIYDVIRKEASVEFSDEVQTLWSTTFHMAALTVMHDMQMLQSHLRRHSSNELAEPKKALMNSLFFKFQGNISIGMVLSISHRVVFSSQEVNLTFNQQSKSAHFDCLTVNFDNRNVFIFKQFAVSLMQENEKHAYNRGSFDNLALPNNRLLSFHIEEFKLVFPYQYNFAEAFNEEFLGIIKWLKQMSKQKKTQLTSDSLLPPDLSIKAKLWTIELQDDPFEVKLRDNFELLEDEYHESLKRTKILDEKIESLQKTNLLLPGEKITELYSKLAKKHAEIYVRRSQQLYQQSPMRTSLALWQLEDVEILAIADTSYHGAEKVVNCMKLLNMESPYPEEGVEYNTLWGRKVRCSTSSWSCTLRDFPQPVLAIKGLHVWGFLIGAEQEGSQRAKRTSIIEIGEPWVNATVERNMPPLKFYHDLTFDIEDMCMSYGPCWEPPMSQFSLAMDLISRPSLDPSPALPWWDKMRLLYHGHLTFSIQHLTLLMRASLDPYNTTEQMELTWSDVIIDYTTGKILTKGDLDVYVHTASKYDDCRVLHIPSLKLSINLDWLCLGNPYDHHSVTPYAPDKIPEYSINQEHDSYRAFRSQNLTILYSFETKPGNTEDFPSMILYSSTLRWIENLKMILTGVTRLTRRGTLFGNTKLRKPQLNRHYRNLRLSLNVHKFHIFYWMSFAKRQGLQLIGSQLTLSSENNLSILPVNDGLKHRPSAAWSIGYLNCELCDIEMWLYDWLQVDADEENTAESFQAYVERSYFLSVNRVSYGREEIVKDVVCNEDKSETPTHRLVVHDLKGAWTKHNRNVVFCLYDSYMKSILLKKNLSTDALRGFKVESQNTPQKLRSQISSQAAPSPISSLQTGHAVSMLQKLISEAEASSVVFTEELEGSTREQLLHGVAACQTDDVLQKKWLIELVNSQVMLRGIETSGYVIVSAAKAQILQRMHRPVWKDRSLVSKTTWVVSFECMQYYATVDAGEPSPSMDNIMWLSVDNIDGRESMIISDLADLVGSGHSVGGVVSKTVGAVSETGSAPIQLQRIVSRCGCQFFYASYGENVDTSSLDEVPPLPENIDIWEKEVAVDSFTLTHHDLEICTNSLQYAMILDLVNNLLLYVEPRKKEANKKLQYMRFQFQLSSLKDQKEPILELQEKVRSVVSKLRRLEKEAYVVYRMLGENPERENIEKLQELENNIHCSKEELNTMNEELTTMICCFKEMQILASKSRQRATSQEKGICVVRRAEVCFKHAQWRLTDADGQLGIADLVISNFLYSKVNKSDESVEHLLEVGYVKVMNLLPNQLYKHVLEPSDVRTSIPLDRQCMLRIYCRERAPVAGISVKEHLELNVIPFTLALTDAFYKAMLKFFFPADSDKEDHQEEQEQAIVHKKKNTSEKRYSIFYSDRDEIEKMKERADKNHTFFYIKIPEVPLRVSYKGKKEKNIEDVHNLSLVLATLEYHNKTWTWLDLLMELKNDAKKTLIHQAIRQTLLAGKRSNTSDKDKEPQEEEKANILFGTKHAGTPERSSRRKFFSLQRRDAN